MDNLSQHCQRMTELRHFRHHYSVITWFSRFTEEAIAFFQRSCDPEVTVELDTLMLLSH